jgi:hypothetical protein
LTAFDSLPDGDGHHYLQKPILFKRDWQNNQLNFAPNLTAFYLFLQYFTGFCQILKKCFPMRFLSFKA